MESSSHSAYSSADLLSPLAELQKEEFGSSFIIGLPNSWHPLKGAPVEKPAFAHHKELDKSGEQHEWGRP